MKCKLLLLRIFPVLFACSSVFSAEKPVRAASASGDSWVYFGSFARGDKGGIYVSKLTADGSLQAPTLAAPAESPSFLAIHSDAGRVVAVCEAKAADGKNVGAIAAYAVDPRTGRLSRTGWQATDGGSFCHVSFDRSFQWVFGARYRDGNAIALPITGDGSLGQVTTTVQHSGKGPNPARQERAHAHSILPDPSNAYVWVADLGTDEIRAYRFDTTRGGLETHMPPAFIAEPGSGPRHFAFHPNGKWVYALYELTSSVAALNYDARTGTMAAFQTVGLLPNEGVTGEQKAAEVVVHPNGKFVYASNRGYDSLVALAVDERNGRLAFIERHRERLAHPRNFAIDPTGHWLLCANRDTNVVTMYRIDLNTGKLTLTDQSVTVPEPVCVRFFPLPENSGKAGRLETHKSIWLR
jgi:6-phosphogluconolactonase